MEDEETVMNPIVVDRMMEHLVVLSEVYDKICGSEETSDTQSEIIALLEERILDTLKALPKGQV